MGISEREALTVAAIDRANGEDPDAVEHRGALVPLQQALGRAAAEWVERLDPTASPAQRLAARAHHLRRWETPRSDHPAGRAGYLRWRRAANRRQAEQLAAVMEEQGWDEATIAAVQGLVRKEGLGHDPVAQVHEDAVCLAFFEVQLDSALETLGDKGPGALRKTLDKMSAGAVARLEELALSTAGRQALDEARRSGDAAPT